MSLGQLLKCKRSEDYLKMKFEHGSVKYYIDEEPLGFGSLFNDGPCIDVPVINIHGQDAKKIMYKLMKEFNLEETKIKSYVDKDDHSFCDGEYLNTQELEDFVRDITEPEESKKVKHMVCFKVHKLEQEWHDVYFKDNHAKREARRKYKKPSDELHEGDMVLVSLDRVTLPTPLPPKDKFGIYEGYNKTWTASIKP